jgi:hypothetical protein
MKNKIRGRSVRNDSREGIVRQGMTDELFGEVQCE